MKNYSRPALFDERMAAYNIFSSIARGCERGKKRGGKMKG